MTDLASLGLRIESQEVETGNRRLDDLAVKAGKAERATDALAGSSKRASTATGQMAQEAMRASTSFDTFYDAANRDFAAQYVRQMGAVSAVHSRTAATAKLTGGEVLNLSRQFSDLGVSAAMGMNPLMIMIQQGPQIADTFQTAATRGMGFKAVLAGIGEMVAPVLAIAGPILAVAGAVGTLASAFLIGQKESADFANAIAITGNYADITADQYERLIRTVVDESRVGYGEARKMVLALAASGKFTGDTIEQLAPSIAKIAQFTGQSADTVANDFMRMGDSVGDFAVKFNEHYHLMTLAQIEHIRRLEDQGRTTDAQLSAAIAIHQQLGKVGPENLGYLERAWRGVGNAISWAWERLKDFGKSSKVTAEAELGAVERALKPGGYSDIDPAFKAAMLRRKAELQTIVDIAKAQADANATQQAAIPAAERMRTTWAGAGDDIARANREVAKYRADIEAIRKANPRSDLIPSAARQAAAEADIIKKYTPDATAAAKAGQSAAESAAKAAQRRAEALAREVDALEATIKGNLALAAAYGVSDEAALRQIAVTKATAAAITKQGDVDAFVARQLRLNVSEQAVNGAKTLATLTAENAARKALNDQVAAGVLTAGQAQIALRDESALRPLIAAAAVAEGQAKERLLDTITKLRAAQAEATAEDQRARLIAMQSGQADQIAMLELQLKLMGSTNRERAVQIAQLQAMQNLKSQGLDPTSERGKATISDAGRIAGLGEDVQRAQDAYNASLYETADILAQIDDQAQAAASGMAAAFGKVGSAMGDVLTLMTRYSAKQAAMTVARKREGVTAQEVADIDRRSAADRIDHYGNLISASKSFFDEGSKGYKALQTAEQVYRAFEFAMSVRAMVQKVTETGVKVAAEATGVAAHGAAATAHVALDATTTASGIAAGAARIFAALGPFGFPVVAAMVAVMAGIGAAVMGGGGGSSSVNLAEQRQKTQGSGSVLGDASAKSESIANSLEIVAANTNRDLEYSNGMLRSLRSIDNQIGAVAAAIARSLNASGAFGTDSLGLGTSGRAPSLSNLGFGSTTTRTLQDQGLTFGTQSLSQILSSGVNAAIYQVVESTKKKSAFGITYSNKTSTSTTTEALDASLAEQFTRIIASLRDTVIAAAGEIGVSGADAMLANFQVAIGNISTKGMTGSEIEEAISAVFSKLGDEMAGAVLPALKDVQKVGEGLFETLVRTARQYQVVDVTLATIGKTFGAVGVSSLGARQRLVDLFGSLDDFTESTSFYAENFLTEAERLLPIQNAVTAELTRLGLSGVKTRDQFKSVVQGLDVSTQAGAELYAALLSLAPAFAKVTEEMQSVTDAKQALSGAYDRERDALTDTLDRFKGFASSLKSYGASLYSGPTAALSPEAQYQATKAEFDRVAALARTGNEDALGSLQTVSQAYLDASKAYYASSAGYFTDLAAVRDAVTAAEASATTQVSVAQQQLDALKSQVQTLIDIDEHVVTVAEAIANLNALMGGAPVNVPATPAAPAQVANDNTDVVEALQEQNATLQQMVANQQAAIQQQAAISAANQAKLDAIEGWLGRQFRESQAS